MLRLIATVLVFFIAGAVFAMDPVNVRPVKQAPLLLLTEWKVGISATRVKQKYGAEAVLTGPYFGDVNGGPPYCPADFLMVRGRRIKHSSIKLNRPIVSIDMATGMFEIYKDYATYKKHERVTVNTTSFAADYTVTDPKKPRKRLYLAKAFTYYKGVKQKCTVWGLITATRAGAHAFQRKLTSKYDVKEFAWLDGGTSANPTRKSPVRLAVNPTKWYKT